MAVTQARDHPQSFVFIGLSGDVKPTDSKVAIGATFLEKDTLAWFIWDGDSWETYVLPASAGGGAVLGEVTIGDGVTTADVATSEPAADAPGLVVRVAGALEAEIDTTGLATEAKQDDAIALLADIEAAADGIETLLAEIEAAVDGIEALLGGSIAVTGTFWQATQPVSGTFWQATQPVSGTFWQATQPVSLATVPSHAVTNAGTFATQAATAGDVAHDSADSGNPVKTGFKSIDLGVTPTAVTAGDRSDAYGLRNGIVLQLGGAPNLITKELNVTDADGAQTDAALVTVSAGTAIVVTGVDVMCDGANTADVACRIGFGTANVPSADGNALVLSHPGIKAGSGISKGWGGGIVGIGASNEDLRVTCEDPVSGAVNILVQYFTVVIG